MTYSIHRATRETALAKTYEVKKQAEDLEKKKKKKSHGEWTGKV